MNDAIAEQFVRARLDATALPDFPGSIPATLNTAYAYQDRAIALWPDFVAGWKVGRIGEPWLERLGEDRLVGPIFRRGIRLAPPEQLVEFPVFEGGFAAVEAEFVFRLGADAPSDKVHWTPDEAARIAMALHIGIETAGSPLATINDLGGAVVVSDFGNNAGLLLGPSIPDWRTRPFESLKTEDLHRGQVGGSRRRAVAARRPLCGPGVRVVALCPARAADEVRLCSIHGRNDWRARYSHRAGSAGCLRGVRRVAVPGRSGAEGSVCAEGSASLVISRRAVLLGVGAACVHAVGASRAVAAAPAC